MAGQAPQLVPQKARFQTLTLRDLEGLTSCFSLQGGNWPRINLQGEVLLQHPKAVYCNELVYSAELEKIQMWPPTLRYKTFTPPPIPPPCQCNKPANQSPFLFTMQQFNDSTAVKSSSRHTNVTSEFLTIQSEVAVSVGCTSHWLNVMSRLQPVLSPFPIFMHY